MFYRIQHKSYILAFFSVDICTREKQTKGFLPVMFQLSKTVSVCKEDGQNLVLSKFA